MGFGCCLGFGVSGWFVWWGLMWCGWGVVDFGGGWFVELVVPALFGVAAGV